MPKKEDLSNVPASVLKQQKDAEQKIADLSKVKAAPDAIVDDPTRNTDDDPTKTVVDPTKVKPAEVLPAISDGSVVDDQWEHKYSVLQGKYNKEVGDLTSMVVDLKASMERQNIVIDGLNSKLNTAPKAKDGLKDLNPDDYTGWGEEMQVMVKQVNQLKSIINDQNEVIKGFSPQQQVDDDGLKVRVASLESDAQDSRVTTYLKHLDSNVNGDWRVLNKDVNFNAWLDKVDPISLQSRRDSLVTAADNLRSGQVTSIFNTYISSSGKNAGVKIADELPGGGGDGGFEQDLSTTTLTQEDVSKAERDFVQGKITEEAFDKIFSSFQSTLRRQQQS